MYCVATLNCSNGGNVTILLVIIIVNVCPCVVCLIYWYVLAHVM
jgi:hypothetical protein